MNSTNASLAQSDAHVMHIALQQAQRAYLLGEVPVGAVMVDQHGNIAGLGYNRSIIDKDPTQHAELMALRQACAQAGNYRLPGYTLFVTLEPCLMCMGALFHARVKRVVFGASDPKTGVCGSVLALHDHTGLNHHTEVHGGVLGQECADLLRRFFQERRQQHSANKKKLVQGQGPAG